MPKLWTPYREIITPESRFWPDRKDFGKKQPTLAGPKVKPTIAGGAITIFVGAANLSKPASLIDHDAVIICLNCSSATPAVTGFTIIGAAQTFSPGGTFCVILAKNNVTAASEPATYTVTGATVFGKGTTKVRGQDQTTLLTGTATTSPLQASSSSIVFPAVTPAVNDAALFCGAAYWVARSDYGTPGSMTRIFQDLASGDNCSEHGQVLSGGGGSSTGTRTATTTGGATEYGSISFCIKPA